MISRQVASFGFLICVVVIAACSPPTNGAGALIAPATGQNARHVRMAYQTPPPAGWQFYSPNPFALPICKSDPCSPTLDANSTSMITQMMAGTFSMGELQIKQPGTTPGPGAADEVPTYYTNGSDPGYSITCTENYTPPCTGSGGLFPTVSIPNGAYASGDSDHHASVIVQSTSQTYEYDFWEFNCYGSGAGSRSVHKRLAPSGKCTGTTYPVYGGGGLTVSYGSACNANSFANRGTCRGSAVAAGVPTQPGLLDPRELTAANIDHTLYVAVGCPNGNHTWPADNSDGYSSGNCNVAGGPGEGERIWLGLSNSKIDKLGDPAWATTILHAMHKYGFFIIDTAGDFNEPWDFYGLDSATFTYINETDPWDTFFLNIGCNVPSNPCGFSNGASHLPIPLNGISQSDIHIVCSICILQGSKTDRLTH
jgi:hypothetical protein